MAATPEQIEQQRRVIVQTKGDVASLLTLASTIRARLNSYTRLNMQSADPSAFEGTGTNAEAYQGAIAALNQIASLEESVFVALEVFAT